MNNRRTGFTLVELMVVLVLVGLLASALLGGLQFTAAAWERGSARSRATQDMVIVQNLLRNQLAGLPLVKERAALKRRIRGTKDSLTLITRYPEQLSAGGLNEFRYQITGDTLTMTWRALDAQGQAASSSTDGTGGTDTITSESRILLEGLAGGQFAFQGASETGGTIDWQDSWDRKIALPGLVRLELDRAEDNPGPLWPTFIGQPRINGAPVLYNLLR
ncbi:prepilin-type N-terminal cleavage/methylation domain-containing protein [Aestuariispira insulae]|nr:prepilin-type N-terminal cleavage/methylation domain-containing protein [Aestuariispira insulae]